MKKRSLFRPIDEAMLLPVPSPQVKQGIQVLHDFGFRANAFQSSTPEPVLTSVRTNLRRESIHVSDLWSRRLRKSFLIATGLEEAHNMRIRRARLMPFIKPPLVGDLRVRSVAAFRCVPGIPFRKAMCRSFPGSQSDRKTERSRKMDEILMKLEDTVESTTVVRRNLSLLYSRFQLLRKTQSLRSKA